ncbi:MAG TPA: hypothetical protein PLG75_06005 [Methanoculleus sp.]|nr:hypothetical protein [Methanoculleus sp.]
MRNLTFGVILAFLLALLIAAAGCTAADPSATAKAGEPEGSLNATVDTAVVFGLMHVKMLEGTNEVFEYIVSGDKDEKTEFLLCMVEADILGDEIWEVIGTSGQADQQVLEKEYGATDELRTAMIISALTLIDEYEVNGNISASSLQAFEDDVEAMRSAYDRFADAYYASLSGNSREISGDATAAITLLAMQEELMKSVGESFEYVALGNAEEKEEFNAGMDRFMAQAEVFNATAGGTAAEQYPAMMDAVAEYRSAADTFFSTYEKNGEISSEAFDTYEAAVDKMRTAYYTLMASVLAKV